MNWYKKIYIFAGKNNLDKKLIHEFGDIKVYLVNGEKVRNSSPEAEEFGTSGTHSFHPKVIPNNEIWIEDSAKDDEINTLIHGRLNELRYLERGEEKYEAYHHSVKNEEKERKDKDKKEGKPLKINKEVKEEIYINRYGNIGDIEIWIVDGEEVRDYFRDEFIEAGHDVVYKWIPKNEIWIEQLHKDEMPYILLHEFTERTIMNVKKIRYDDAHIIAAKIEFAQRKKNNFNKKDILNMTGEEALELYEKYK